MLNVLATAALELNLQGNVDDDEVYKDCYQQLQQQLLMAMTHRQWRPVERAASGRLLGKLGDPRPGVGLIRERGVTLPEIDWVLIEAKAKTFLMGEGNAAHPQTMENDYKLSRYPVTNAQFAAFVDAGGYQTSDYWTERGWQFVQENKLEYPRFWHDSTWNIDNHPVVGVSWFEAMAFCHWLNRHIDTGTVRLPNEKEWEFAARGEQSLVYPWGKDWQDSYANAWESAIQMTSAVGLFEQAEYSPFALEDMSGNVWEWVQDGWSDNYGGALTDSSAWNAVSGGGRVLRGGSWINDAGNLRSASRDRGSLANRYYYYGFRLALGQD